MASVQHTRTSLGDILIRVYAKGRVEQLQNITSPIYESLGKASNFTIGGDFFIFGVNVEGDESFGYIDEAAGLPEAGVENTQQAKLRPRVFAGQIQFTGLSRAISRRDAHAFLSAIQYAADQKLKRMMSYCEGVLFRDGTGLLGLANGAVVASTSLVMDTPGVQWLRAGMKIDAINAANAKQISGIEVTDVNWVTNTATLASAQSCDDNCAIYKSQLGQSTFAGTEKEVVGLQAALAETGTYLTISRATHGAWRGNRVNAASAEINEDLLLRAENRPLVVGGVAMSDIRNYRMIWHPNQRRQYFKLVQVQKQFTGLSLDAGYSRLTWNGHEAIESYNVPETSVWIGDWSQFQHFVAPDGELQLDQTFGSPVKWLPGFDAGVMYWRGYDNYAVRKPNALVEVHTLANVGTR